MPEWEQDATQLTPAELRVLHGAWRELHAREAALVAAAARRARPVALRCALEAGWVSLVKGTVLVRPWLVTTGSSGCIRRPEAVLRSREERPGAFDLTVRPWPFRQKPPKLTVSLRWTIQVGPAAARG